MASLPEVKSEDDKVAEQLRVEKKNMKNKTKVLIMTTRGVTTRFRHLLQDLMTILPHAKKESKLDTKNKLDITAEFAEIRNCDTILLFEARKRQDLYLWLSKSPFGPTLKFHVANLHTMLELSFPGNNLMYSRPLVTFDPQFDQSPILRLMKEMLGQLFSAPSGHRKTKPFIDHVVTFTLIDGRIWFRHYQIVDAALDEKVVDKSVESTLVEIGPRFVLAPIKCMSGTFTGSVLWENPSYIGPNEIRRVLKKRQGDKTYDRVAKKRKRALHVENNPIEHPQIDKIFR